MRKLLAAAVSADDDKSCKTWPNFSKLPIECCSVPELFKPEIKDKCIANCSRPSEPSFNTWCCTIQCIFDEVGLTSDGNFSRENAKTILPKAFEKPDKMTKVVSEIVDKCDALSK